MSNSKVKRVAIESDYVPPSAASLRLHMGELDADELRVAMAAHRLGWVQAMALGQGAQTIIETACRNRE